ncbi:serine hydrolase [Desulfonatronum parangueonense]
MRKSIRTFSLLIFIIVLITGCGGGSGEESGHVAAVENSLIPAVIKAGEESPLLHLEDRMRHFRVPGVGIAVVNNGVVEWAKGYGVLEAGGSRAVNWHTVFQACSISKPVAVTGIMLLAQSRTLDITRNVNDYLTSWILPDTVHTIREKATVERLMSHTGGTSVGGFDGYAPGEALPTILQILQGISPSNSQPVEVVYVPGTKGSYSGGGMEVLHLMTQEVTGMPLREYMQRHLFTPLGMSRSDFAQPLEGPLATNAAKGHDGDGSVVPGGWNTYPELVAAGLWTTPSDLGLLLVEMINAARGHGIALEQKTAMNILTLRPNSEFGLGFKVETRADDLVFKHTGGNRGYRTYFMGWRDRGQGVVVMTNGESGTSLVFEIVRSVARAYGWPDIEEPEEAQLVDVPRATLLSYVGTYVGTYRPTGNEAIDMDFQVYLEDSGLMLRLAHADGSGRMDLYPVAQDEFLFRGDFNGTLVFSVDAQGRTTGFSIPQMCVTARKVSL